jgi:hypothetical protein
VRAWLLLAAGCDAFYGLEHQTGGDDIPGLVARYPMNDLGDPTRCMSDTVGGHDGVCEGVEVMLAPGDCGSGYHFNGSATVHIGHASTFDLPAFTIVYQLHLDQPLDTGMCPVERVFGTGDGNSWSYCFEPAQTDLVAVDDSGNNQGSNGNGDPLEETRWHQIAITYGSGTMTGYVDTLPGPSLALPMVRYDQSDTVLGADITSGTPQRTFVGTLDDLRIFDHPLTSTELASLACE